MSNDNVKDELNDDRIYRKWYVERRKLLDKISKKLADKGTTMAQVEKEIEQALRAHFKYVRELPPKHKDKYFNLEVFTNLHWAIKEFFPVKIIVGIRNIGKTTAGKTWLEKAPDGEFMFWRLIKEEIEEFIDTEEGNWFLKNNWALDSKKSGRILDDANGETVGWAKSLNSSAKLKSIEFPKVKRVYFDEFNTDNVKYLQDLGTKLITLVITLQRQKEEFDMVLTSNVSNPDADIIEKLVGHDVTIDSQCGFINWVTGTIYVNLEDDAYEEFKNEENIGYRAALDNFDVYAPQYANRYKKTIKKNRLPISMEWMEAEYYDHFIWHVGQDDKFVVRYYPHKDIYLLEKISPYSTPPADIPQVTHDTYLCIRNDVQQVPHEYFYALATLWLQGRCYARTENQVDAFSELFAQILKNVLI